MMYLVKVSVVLDRLELGVLRKRQVRESSFLCMVVVRKLSMCGRFLTCLSVVGMIGLSGTAVYVSKDVCCGESVTDVMRDASGSVGGADDVDVGGAGSCVG